MSAGAVSALAEQCHCGHATAALRAVHALTMLAQTEIDQTELDRAEMHHSAAAGVQGRQTSDDRPRFEDLARLEEQLAEADANAARLAADHDALKRRGGFKWRVADAESRAVVAAREAKRLRVAWDLASLTQAEADRTEIDRGDHCAAEGVQEKRSAPGRAGAAAKRSVEAEQPAAGVGTHDAVRRGMQSETAVSGVAATEMKKGLLCTLWIFYAKHAPDKIDDAQRLVTRYWARRSELDILLRSLYGTDTRTDCGVAMWSA